MMSQHFFNYVTCEYAAINNKYSAIGQGSLSFLNEFIFRYVIT